MMDVGMSVIKCRTPGGPGYNTVHTAVPHIAEFLERSLLNFTVRALRILSWLLYFFVDGSGSGSWKIAEFAVSGSGFFLPDR
jgi:hypothetical protein